MKYSVAVITPQNRGHYSTNTVLDGLIQLSLAGVVDFRVLPKYPSPFDLKDKVLSKEDFISYAKTADLIILAYGKNSVDFEMAKEINCWFKTVFLDGGELGGDLRYDPKIREELISGTYLGNGSVNKEMLDLCGLYLKREKPYISGVHPFPFGIESRYIKFNKDTVKDIDFACIFGQEDYPKLRKEAREYLEDFCTKNNFTCYTKTTKGFTFEKEKTAGRDEYYSVLARSKVGISIGGGGFDTARFWETLANNCLLITEKIDIYKEDSNSLKYKRIYEFEDLDSFKEVLEKVALFLKEKYSQDDLYEEYEEILKDHSSVRRVLEIFELAKKKGIIA